MGTGMETTLSTAMAGSLFGDGSAIGCGPTIGPTTTVGTGHTSVTGTGTGTMYTNMGIGLLQLTHHGDGIVPGIMTVTIGNTVLELSGVVLTGAGMEAAGGLAGCMAGLPIGPDGSTTSTMTIPATGRGLAAAAGISTFPGGGAPTTAYTGAGAGTTTERTTDGTRVVHTGHGNMPYSGTIAGGVILRGFILGAGAGTGPIIGAGAGTQLDHFTNKSAVVRTDTGPTTMVTGPGQAVVTGLSMAGGTWNIPRAGTGRMAGAGTGGDGNTSKVDGASYGTTAGLSSGAGNGSVGNTNQVITCTNGAARRRTGYPEPTHGPLTAPSGSMDSFIIPRGGVGESTGDGCGLVGSGSQVTTSTNMARHSGLGLVAVRMLKVLVGYGCGTVHGGNGVTTHGVNKADTPGMSMAGSGPKFSDGITNGVHGNTCTSLTDAIPVLEMQTRTEAWMLQTSYSSRTTFWKKPSKKELVNLR